MSAGIFKAWSCFVRENTTVYSIIGQKVTRMYKWATQLFCVTLLLCHFASVAKRQLSSYILRTMEMQAGSRCTTTYPSQVHWLVKTQVTSSNYTDITGPVSLFQTFQTASLDGKTFIFLYFIIQKRLVCQLNKTTLLFLKLNMGFMQQG